MSDISADTNGPIGADADRLTAGDLSLDVRDQRAWLRGEPLRIGGKAFAVLHRLMRSPQVLVTKDALLDAAWPGLAVSESVLTTAVKELRQALGDDARDPQFIETAHGRGYRFLRPVVTGDLPPLPKPAATDAPSMARRSRLAVLIAAGVVLAGVIAGALWFAFGPEGRPSFGGPHPKSIAVLPFKDLSPDHSGQWFADGLTEEVLSTLARTADLRVAARLPANQDLAATLRERRVSHVLTGAIRHSGDRVRVTADLIRTADGVHVWSQSYDRSNGDIISIQEDVGVQIARALKTATDPAKLRAMSASGAKSVEAYEAYLRGLALDRRQLEEGDLAYARQAADAYELARRLDPTFAAANWRAARNWFGDATRVDTLAPGEGPPEAVRLARYFERVDAAIANSQDETERLKYRASRAAMQLHFRLARSLMERYVEARPRDIDAWEDLAQFHAYVGDRRGVARAARRVHALSVEAGDARSRAITLMAMSERFTEAADIARDVVRLKPDAALVLYQAHRAAIWAGRRDEARDYLKRLQASALPENNKQQAALRQACADHQVQAARRLYAKLATTKRLSTRFNAAEIIGDKAAAIRALAPLDTPDRLPTLMQFLIYPTFDAAAYPNLTARLAADGVVPSRPITEPYGCSAGGR